MTSPYPMVIDKITLGYQRGSSDKEYHLVLIQTADKRAMVITRFGKRGTWGQMDVLMNDNPPHLVAAFRKKYEEKTGKGYEETHKAMSLNAGDEADLRRHLGDGYLLKLSADQKAFLIGKSTDGGEPGWINTKPAEPVAKKPTEAERYANNPLWGAF